MLVSELIKQLSEMDQTLPVYVSADHAQSTTEIAYVGVEKVPEMGRVVEPLHEDDVDGGDDLHTICLIAD